MSSEWSAPPSPGGPGSHREQGGPRAEELMPFGVPPDPPEGGTPSSTTGDGGDGGRRRDRRALRPLWFSLPVVLLALLVAGYMLGMYLWSWSAGRSYQQGSLQEARQDYLAQIPWGKLGTEEWVADYNTGTTLLAQGYLDTGVAYLELAYTDVPRATEVAEGRIEPYSYECRVRMNLTLGLEAQGDLRLDEDAPSEAADLYGRALDLVTPCQSSAQSDSQSGSQSGDQDQSGDQSQSGDQDQSGGQSGSDEGASEEPDPGEEAGEAHDRLEGKQRDAEDQAQGGSSPSPSTSPSPGSSPSDSDQSPDTSASPSPSASPTATPTPSASTGFEGETPQERQRREELERRQEDQQNSQDNQYDRNRSGNSTGGW